MPTVPAITPQIEQAVQGYFAKHPDQQQVFERDYGGDIGGWLNAFTAWWDENGGSVGDLSPYADELGLLNNLGFDNNAQASAGGPNSTPIEQGLYNTVAPSLIADVNQDANRRNIATALGQQVVAGGAAASDVLNRTQGGHFDGQTYLNQNPDVAAEYQRQLATNPTLNIDTFAEQHYLQNGQREGRQPAYIQSPQLAQDFNNAATTTAANISASNAAFATNAAALGQATAALQQNLTGALAQRAGALTQQIATLTQNLDQLDATQRQALTQSIAAQQADLEQSIASQKQALQTQLAALGGAATAEAQAKRASLQQEIAGLNAAQAPVAQARLMAADLQATSINVGLERTKDQLTADQAAQGYVGGSTIGDSALARATVDARQRAAEAMGTAQLANATDTRDIGVRGATGERTIADALAGANRDIGTLGANSGFTLDTAGAVGRQRLGDLGATGAQTLTNQTALSRAGIGAQGANTTFQDQVFGADQQRSLADALATGTYGLTATNAANTLAANQQGNAARASYYDNNFARTLNGAIGLTQIPTNVASSLTALDNYGTSGLARTQGLLGWWNTNPNPAPTPGALAVSPSTAGNATSALGAGIFGTALNVGAANNWWRTPTPARTVTPGGTNEDGGP